MPSESMLRWEHGPDGTVALYEDAARGAAAERFEPDGAGAGEGVEHRRAFGVSAKQVEERLAHHVGHGARHAGVRGRLEHPATMRSGDDPHGGAKRARPLRSRRPAPDILYPARTLFEERHGMKSRTPFVGGNWKMNTTLSTGSELVRGVADALARVSQIDVAVFPPFPYLVAIGAILRERHGRVKLGAQDVYQEPDGAFTGEVSVSMLKGLRRPHRSCGTF
jgi:hypothetical protein